MTTYYADLDIAGAGGDGSAGLPWGAEGFWDKIMDLTVTNGDTIKVTGSHDYTIDHPGESLVFNKKITIENWLSNIPWRIKLHTWDEYFGTSPLGNTLRSGIIDASFFRLGNGDTYHDSVSTIYNCHIKCGDFRYAGQTLNVYGSTLIAATVNNAWDVAPYFESCVIDAPFPFSPAVNSDYCVFTQVSLPSGSHTNYQTGWTPPAWPSWNAPASSFNNSVLGVGINTPPEPGNSPYTGYAVDMWGNARTGIGAMNFAVVITTFYADLDLSGTGGDGSSGNPWHVDTFAAQCNAMLAIGSIIKVKGSAAIGGLTIAAIGYTGTITVENWISDPIRLDTSAGTLSVMNGSTLKNCIAQVDDLQILAGATFLDCYIKASYRIWEWQTGAAQVTFKGCTLVTPELYAGEICGSVPTDFIDSIIDCPAFFYFDGSDSSRCCFTIAAIPGIGTHTDAQVNWTPPAWPAWNDPQSSFLSSILSADIDYPPQPGSSPYTGYDKGLWETARIGVGSMSFDSIDPPPGPATYYADLDLPGTGGAGTSGDPWTAEDLWSNTYDVLTAGSIIKVKGAHEYGIGINIALRGLGVEEGYGPITMENWDADGYRIKCEGFTLAEGSVLKNAIVESSWVNNACSYMRDCYIKTGSYVFLDIYQNVPIVPEAVGCTIIASIDIDAGTPCGNVTATINDSIVDSPALDFWGAVTTNRCVFTIASEPLGTHTNAQFSWTPQAWPSWSDPQSMFSSSVLSTGILTPPQPGNPPYTDYEDGLFSSARAGIGALFFNGLVTGDRYIAKVTANGWIKDHIYEWDGTQWIETVPVEGTACFIKDLKDLYIFNGSEWVENDVPWLDPVIEIFDNTGSLPAAPSNGDRYIALVTANGWTINNVYEWNSNNWVETVPVAGMMVFNNDTSEALLYSGSAWVPFTPLTAHAIGGPLHTASTVTDIKTKVSGPDFLITSQPGEISSLPAKLYTHHDDLVMIEDSEDSNEKKQVVVGDMTPWLWGTGAPPATTGLPDGALYIKYIP